MLTDIQKVVLAKVMDSGEVRTARKGVSAGQYDVDFTVRVNGSVKVREDYERAATTSVPWTEVTAMMREGFRVTVEGMIAKMDRGEAVTRGDLVEIMENGPVALGFAVECVRKSLVKGESAVGKVREVVELEDAVKGLLSDISGNLPSQTVPGAVVLDVSVEPVVAMTRPEISAEINPPLPAAV